METDIASLVDRILGYQAVIHQDGFYAGLYYLEDPFGRDVLDGQSFMSKKDVWEETFKQGVILDYPGSLFAASSLCTYPLKCHVDFLDVINSHVAVVLYPDDKSYYQEHDKNPARAVVLAWVAYKKGSGL